MITSRFLRAAFLIFTITVFSNCTFTNTYKDREEDKNEAERISNLYYSSIKTKDYETASSFFSQEFWKVTSKPKLLELYKATQNKLGDLQSTKLDHWETTVTTGDRAYSEYLLYYLNQYKNFQAKETLRLLKDEKGIIHIVAFNINSDGFLK